jgi:hypothetical protein
MSLQASESKGFRRRLGLAVFLRRDWENDAVKPQWALLSARPPGESRPFDRMRGIGARDRSVPSSATRSIRNAITRRDDLVKSPGLG